MQRSFWTLHNAVLTLTIHLAAFTNSGAASNLSCLIEVPSDNPVFSTGWISSIQDAGSDLLVGAEHGLFRFDTSLGQVVAVRGVQTGQVLKMQELADGGMLVGTRVGLFSFDRMSKLVAAVGGAETSQVNDMQKLVGGGILIGAEIGLFSFDTPSGVTMAVRGAATGRVNSIHELPGGGALIDAYLGLFRFDPTSGEVLAVRGAATGRVNIIHELAGGDALMGTEEGLYRYDNTSGQLVAVGGYRGTREIYSIHELTSGAVLIGTSDGLYRFDTASLEVEDVSGIHPGEVFDVRQLGVGRVLIGAEDGLFRFDTTLGELRIVPGVRTRNVRRIYELAGGGVLIGTDTGLFRLDTASGRTRAIGGDDPGDVNAVRPLGGGHVLIGAQYGLYRAILDHPVLPDAMRPHTPLQLDRKEPSQDRVSPIFAFRHPCALVADRLELMLEAWHVDKVTQNSPVQLRSDLSQASDMALIDGKIPFVFDHVGDWKVTLRHGEVFEHYSTTLTAPLRFAVAAPGIVARITAMWEWIVGGLAVLYAVAFVALLAGTRFSSAAFRILSDAVWAKWLTWPFVFLRHVPAVQRWVLEPWFQEARRTLSRGVPHLNPPVTQASGGATAEASGLLPRLRETPRLWLQGRSGMGKSSVFAAWERSYFSVEEGASLRSAARRYGFILVMLPVRHYAALPPPEPNRPESWVIEAVRRRFEIGLGELDHATVRSMLKAGHIALALDGMNEADREDALVAFARQFPQVRLLVTSQTGQEGWDLWQLPPDVAQLRQGLLMLWLGAEKGAELDRRVVAEGLSETILSGYDLRLIADLAGADPAQAVLPANRIALYKTMLARATDAVGEPMRLEGLKALAWTIVTERRREIAAADAARLGDTALKALTREGVRILRQVGKLHEFRHDQMRGFLAALWLAEELPSVSAMQEAMTNANAFSLPRRDQEEVWRFLAGLVATEDGVKELWSFSTEKPAERGLLLAALQEEADSRDITFVRATRGQKRLKA